MKYPHRVRMTLDIHVSAETVEEAKEIAQRHVDAMTVPAYAQEMRVTRDWKYTAKVLLEDGMSQREVAETLHIDRASISREFPGTGWTREEGSTVAALQHRVREYERRLGIR